MSRRAVLIAALALGVLVLGLASRSGAAVAMSVPLLVFFGAMNLRRPPRIEIELTRVLSATRVTAGAVVEVTLGVSNLGGRQRELYLRDRVPEGVAVTEGTPEILTHLAPGARVEYVYRVRARRGEHRWAGATVTAAGAAEVSVEAVSTLLVLPAPERLARISIEPRQTRGFVGPIAGRRAGSGISFWGIREYQSGDPLTRINARLSARHPESILVSVHEQDRIADVTVILDAREGSWRLARGRFEASVTAAATLADTFLAAGNRVALMVLGDGLAWVPPGYGRVQRERIRERLARARWGASFAYERLEQIPRALLPARSQIALVCPLEGPDLAGMERLRSLGYAVLLVRPVTAAREEGGDTADHLGRRLARVEEDLLLARLRRVGAVVVPWDTGTPLATAMRRTRHGGVSR